MSSLTLSADARRLARKLAGAASHVPVVVVEGNAAPRELGEGYFWTTLSGKTRIRYPNAYKYPKTYHASTIRVEVGEGWLRELAQAASVVRDSLLEGRQIQIDARGVVAEPQGPFVVVRTPLVVRKPWAQRAARLDVWGWA